MIALRYKVLLTINAKHGILIYSGYYQIYKIYSIVCLNLFVIYSVVYLYLLCIFTQQPWWLSTAWRDIDMVQQKTFILISRNLMAVTQRRLHDCLGRTSTHRWTPPARSNNVKFRQTVNILARMRINTMIFVCSTTTAADFKSFTLNSIHCRQLSGYCQNISTAINLYAVVL